MDKNKSVFGICSLIDSSAECVEESVDEDCLSATALALVLKEERKKRRQWSKAWLIQINSLSHVNLMKELVIG